MPDQHYDDNTTALARRNLAFSYIQDTENGQWRPLTPKDFSNISLENADITIDNSDVVNSINSGNSLIQNGNQTLLRIEQDGAFIYSVIESGNSLLNQLINVQREYNKEISSSIESGNKSSFRIEGLVESGNALLFQILNSESNGSFDTTSIVSAIESGNENTKEIIDLTESGNYILKQILEKPEMSGDFSSIVDAIENGNETSSSIKSNTSIIAGLIGSGNGILQQIFDKPSATGDFTEVVLAIDSGNNISSDIHDNTQQIVDLSESGNAILKQILDKTGGETSVNLDEIVNVIKSGNAVLNEISKNVTAIPETSYNSTNSFVSEFVISEPTESGSKFSSVHGFSAYNDITFMQIYDAASMNDAKNGNGKLAFTFVCSSMDNFYLDIGLKNVKFNSGIYAVMSSEPINYIKPIGDGVFITVIP